MVKNQADNTTAESEDLVISVTPHEIAVSRDHGKGGDTSDTGSDSNDT